MDSDEQPTPGSRLRQLRQKTGMSATEFAASIGVKSGTYTHHENGTRAYAAEEAIRYARRLKTTPEFLMFGVTGGTPRGIVKELESRAGAGGGGSIDMVNVTDQSGTVVAAEIVKDHWQIPESYLRGELRLEASRALIIEVSGDSGYDPLNPHAPGSLFPGDRVIVDARDTGPTPPGPFLIYDGTGFVVKLCEPVHGSDPPAIRLSSRNPGYRSYEITVDDGHRIVGRIRGRISAM